MITINWATKVIYVPKADMNQIQVSPSEIYELSIDNFRLALKDLEDNSEGMPYPTTHNHNPPVTVGGVTLARVVEIINNYTITFEDGQYAVNLVGANSNIADRANINQVSIRVANSAGLVQTREIEHASFNERVTVDIVNGVSGTTYPTGTQARPVNNLTDAIFIANLRGFKELYILSDLTIPTGVNLDDYVIKSPNWNVVTVETGASLLNTFFEKVSLYGVMGGVWNVLVDCWVYDITNFSGWVRGGSIGDVTLSVGTVNAEFGGQSFFDDIVPLFPGNVSSITMNTDTLISFTNNADTTTIKSLTSGSAVNCGLLEGEIIIDSTCTGGAITVSGVGVLTNNSLITVDTDGLVNKEEVTGGLTTEQNDKLMSITGGGGGVSINYQAINSHTTSKFNELKDAIKEIPITDLTPIGQKLSEIDSHIEFAKEETIDRIEEAEIDLRKDINRGKSEIKDDNIKTRNLVRQKSEKVVKYAEKQLDRQEKLETMIEDEAEEIESDIERLINEEMDMIEKEKEAQIEKEIQDIESNLSNNGNDNGTEG